MTPVTKLGQALCLLYVPFAVVFVSTQLGSIGDAVMAGFQEEGKMEKLLKMDLSLEAMIEMDEDGDGEVDEYEFLKFMLVTSGLVEESAIDMMHQTFQTLDADGSGSLDMDDLLVEPLGKTGDDCEVAHAAVVENQSALDVLVDSFSKEAKDELRMLTKDMRGKESSLGDGKKATAPPPPLAVAEAAAAAPTVETFPSNKDLPRHASVDLEPELTAAAHDVLSGDGCGGAPKQPESRVEVVTVGPLKKKPARRGLSDSSKPSSKGFNASSRRSRPGSRQTSRHVSRDNSPNLIMDDRLRSISRSSSATSSETKTPDSSEYLEMMGEGGETVSL